uniref:Uncharacterized protein n=1 Tax=Ciona savignyi TaxID=51511 RepID=H2Z6N3_CIOSA
QFPRVHASNPGGSFSVLLSSPGTTPCSESSLASYITSAPSAESCELRDTPSPLSSVGSLENSSAGLSFAQCYVTHKNIPLGRNWKPSHDPQWRHYLLRIQMKRKLIPTTSLLPPTSLPLGMTFALHLTNWGQLGKERSREKRGKGKGGRNCFSLAQQVNSTNKRRLLALTNNSE